MIVSLTSYTPSKIDTTDQNTNIMPTPTPLSIATSSLNRLVKEESSYHKELSQQQARIAKLEAGEGKEDENAEFVLKQEVSTSSLRLRGMEE